MHPLSASHPPSPVTACHNISGGLRKSYSLLVLALLVGFILLEAPSIRVQASPQAAVFSPIADSYVQGDKPATNYGTAAQLRTDGSPAVRSFIKFDVQGLSGTIEQVTLRIYANSQQSVGFEVHQGDNLWSETALIYDNQPGFSPAIIAASGKVVSNHWYDLDVTSSIGGNGEVSYVLTTRSSTALSLASRESAFGPQLLVTTDGENPTPAVTSTPSPLPTPAPTAVEFTPTPSPTETSTPTSSPTETFTPSPSPADTSTPTSSPADTSTPTSSPADTSTPTSSPVETFTPSPSPADTSTPTSSPAETSTPTPTATPGSTSVPPGAAGDIVFSPIADSYVQGDKPATNYGTAAQLRTDGSPAVRSFIKFDVQGLKGTIEQVTLRIYANSQQSVGFEVHQGDNLWSETALIYDNQPGFSPAIIAASGKVVSNHWYDLDVTSSIGGNGEVSYVLTTRSSTALSLASRESAFGPQLLVTTDGENPTPAVTSTPSPLPTPAPAGTDPVVIAAGDIVCDSSTDCVPDDMAASQVAIDQNPDAVLVLGDLCHTPSADCFDNYYAPTWGRSNAISYPITGNHEYMVTGAQPYFDYWNGAGNTSGRAGDRSQGYYSFDLGSWHVIALNSQCEQVGGCNSGSRQYTWLQQDLQNHPNACTLVYYHIPVFSSGGRANNNMLQIFTLLYNKGAEVVLNGHDHIYERFAPQDPAGRQDAARGIREFIAGTGGANHTFIASVAPNSEVRNEDTFGALKLTLHPDGYDWQFMPVAGKTFTDSGSSACH